MENKLKVGQTFEVVEVLTDGDYYDKTLFKINGFTIASNHAFLNGLNVLKNGINLNDYNSKMFYMSINKKEIKPIGKLKITKVK